MDLQDPATSCDACNLPGTEENPVGGCTCCGIETYAHADCNRAKRERDEAEQEACRQWARRDLLRRRAAWLDSLPPEEREREVNEARALATEYGR